MAYFELRPTCASPDYPIYGAEWAGTSDPSWTRTDAASSFSDPNPYYAGMSTTPSSPFDNISPWKDMVISEDSEAGTLVSIPKFYFKWTRTGDKMKLQISMHQYDGFLTSPAHADRGDGKGERDIVYVGRYHCASDYKSKTGVTPRADKTITAYRNNIHNLGNTIFQWDLALLWTIRMLFLVEFANWNVKTIGYGGGEGTTTPHKNGRTDTLPYHTGTESTNPSSVIGDIHYRYIENLWSNTDCWIDGVYFMNGGQYCFTNPQTYDFSQSGTLVGNISGTYQSGIMNFTSSNVVGLEYAMSPILNSSVTMTTYCCAATWGNFPNASTKYALRISGSNANEGCSLFNYITSYAYTAAGYSARLMKLP